MDQRGKDGVASIGLDTICGEKIDALAEQCLQTVGEMHEAKSHGPTEVDQKVDVALGSLLVAGIGTEEFKAGDRELLGKVSVILAEDGNNLRLCQ